ncbi:MAG: hypothetical protein ACOH2T_19180 [Pseudomonas sp.]
MSLRGLDLIPEHMHSSITLYVEQGIEPGRFLMLMLEHRIYEAAGMADAENLQALPNWIIFMHNYIPAACHGSPVVVQAWMKSRRKMRNSA